MNSSSILDPVFWDTDSCSVMMIEQRILPFKVIVLNYTNVDKLAQAICDMVVRGAPSIGIAAAYGMVLSAKKCVEKHAKSDNFSNCDEMCTELIRSLTNTKKILDSTRPTAVNLMFATTQIIIAAESYCEKAKEKSQLSSLLFFNSAYNFLLCHAHFLKQLNYDGNISLANHGLEIVKKLDNKSSYHHNMGENLFTSNLKFNPYDVNILHHCNTGPIAAGGYGTALGVIHNAHINGMKLHVWVDETRPRLQGSRLTAFELSLQKIPYHLIADNCSGMLMRSGKVDLVIFGADRIAHNGDVANKIGTFNIAVLAKVHGIPVYSAAPTTTIDLSIKTGNEIPIEERNGDEVRQLSDNITGVSVTISPNNCPVFNPAFDVCPHEYLSGIITEEGICYPPFEVSLARVCKSAKEKISHVLKDAIIKNL